MFFPFHKIHWRKRVAMKNFNNRNNLVTLSNFHGLIPQVQSPQPSYFRTEEPAHQETKNSEETKTKPERWTAGQAEDLVSFCVENFKVLESSHCNQIWPKLVNKYALSSTENTQILQGENTKLERFLQEMWIWDETEPERKTFLFTL